MQKNYQLKLDLKNIIIKILIVFVGISIAFLIYKNGKQYCESDVKNNVIATNATNIKNRDNLSKSKSESENKVAKKSPVKKENRKAVVYYFYTAQRCPSCILIENYTKKAIEKNFSTPYKGWEVSFVGVNVDEPSNRHFIYDYLLRSKSVVVQKFKDGKPDKWVNLIQIWYLLGNKNNFINYITEETKRFLDNDN